MFQCKPCSYSTERSTDLERHKKTKKHLANEQKCSTLNINESINTINTKETQKQHKLITTSTIERDKEFLCKMCGKSFPFYQSMWRHTKKFCTAKNNLDDQCMNNTDQCTDQSEKPRDVPIVKKLEEENKELKEQNKILLSLAMQNSKTAAGSVRTMTYAMRHLKNAPDMKLLEGNEAIKLLTYDNKKSPNDTIETIIKKYKNKLLDKHFGDIIINAYKKDDPELQSFWGVDTSRLHFILKQNQWVSDKSGTRLTELVIDPFLCKVDEMIRAYISERTQNEYNKGKKYTPSTLGDFPTNFVYCNEILMDISKKKLHKRLLQHISPHFELTPNAINTISAKKRNVCDNSDSESHIDSMSTTSSEHAKKPKKIKKVSRKKTMNLK
jgi:hypothetical protein